MGRCVPEYKRKITPNTISAPAKANAAIRIVQIDREIQTTPIMIAKIPYPTYAFGYTPGSLSVLSPSRVNIIPMPMRKRGSMLRGVIAPSK